MNFNTNILTFKNRQLGVVKQGGRPWLTLADIAAVLYGKGGDQTDPPSANAVRQVQQLYQRHADEFSATMTTFVGVATAGGKQMVRIFSLRGAHLLAMFARTPVAKEFRRWVLDILDQEVVAEPAHATRLTPQVKERLAHLCHEVAYIRSWWDHWSPAFREINQKGIAAPAHDHMTMATAWATGLVRDLSLPDPFPQAKRYSWLR